MVKIIKFGGMSVAIGVVVGLGIVAWLYAYHPGSRSAAQSSPASSTGTDGSVLSVTSSSGNTMQGEPLSGASSTSGGGSGSGSNAGSSSSSQLPSPSDFSVYDQYKNSATALYIDPVPGTGASVAKGSSVTIEYSVWLTTGQEIGGTSPNKPYTFTEGAGTVIPGIEEAIFGMKVGGQRRLIIPPQTAFGTAGKSPVPPNAVMIFDVKLTGVS